LENIIIKAMALGGNFIIPILIDNATGMQFNNLWNLADFVNGAVHNRFIALYI